MLVGSVGIPRGINGFGDREAWLINHSGLSQEDKDRWNAARALALEAKRK
ncbi:MAG: hypothetical protein LBC30_04690 [Puniceicoccales bacterium]|jgi:hypothetical protein|nr:hypothetical protein [Puniceicoccales bacterium]